MPSQVREKNILHFTVVWGTMPSAYTKHTPKICAASGFAGAAAGGLKSESENKELGGRSKRLFLCFIYIMFQDRTRSPGQFHVIF